MELSFSSEAPQQKNFLKSVGKAGKNIGNAAKKVLPVAQRILPVAAVIVPALRPVAAIVDAIPARR
jgi:hypothetical protein